MISTNVVQSYLKEQFLIHLDSAIQQSIIAKKMEKVMPQILSEHMMIGLLNSVVKNNQLPEKLQKEQIQKIEEKCSLQKDISILKKIKRHISNPIKPPTNTNGQYSSQQHIEDKKDPNISLVKLSGTEQEEGEEVNKLRKMKARLRQFEKYIQSNGEAKQLRRKNEHLKKKSTHSHCAYHTYDYQTNILQVCSPRLKEDFGDVTNGSLLEIIKRNLDEDIEKRRLQQRLAKLENSNAILNIPEFRKQKVSTEQAVLQQKLGDEDLRRVPSFPFQQSHIDSLSKNMEDYLSNGVKMVTHQQKLVEEITSGNAKQVAIRKQKISKQKAPTLKQQTQISQSIIYSLEPRFNKQTDPIHQSKQSKSLPRKYNSLQMETHDYDDKNDQSSRNYEHIECDFKLPQINYFSRRQPKPKQRNSTDHRIVRGLSSIQIADSSSKYNRKQDFSSGEARQQSFSALMPSKKTESSLECNEQYQQAKNSISKKQYIKEYFNKYGEQFKHRREKIDKLSNLYF